MSIKRVVQVEIYLNAKLKVKKWDYFLVNPKKDRYLNNLENLHL